MAFSSPKPKPTQPRRIMAKVLMNHHGGSGSDDCITSIRCNGREFWVDMSPTFLRHSPVLESRYREFIAALEAEFDGEEYEEEVLEDYQEWLIAALEPIFLELAPDVLPSFDPEKLATGEAHPLLSEYLFPQEYWCRLETENDKAYPVYLPDHRSPFGRPRSNDIPPELEQELEQCGVRFFDPAEVEVAFRRPVEALGQEPTRVLVELDTLGRKTLCFFKTFSFGGEEMLERELKAHLRVIQSSLAPDARVARLHGVVTVDGRIAGMLLTQIDHGKHTNGPLYEKGLLYVPIPLRQRWAKQIRETVEQFHDAGLVWGDAKAENVMIDRNDDAWLIDLGGGYTEGWVDKDKAGTKEGDLQGLDRILEHLSNEEYESFSDTDSLGSDSARCA
ncbi:hypothetical protein QBC43DRAFT_323178 [Cladorrhinum sp. PSN259]|nr:hypothetical protein QBC43DRAFT_323178 [Cladorrhinum sp. PSN259]